jgi:4'-phosphopantetheinyl transferase
MHRGEGRLRALTSQQGGGVLDSRPALDLERVEQICLPLPDDVPPEPGMFAYRGVEVLSLPLTAGRSELAALAKTLSPDERQRAARYRYEPGRNRFIVGRARLRQVLASRLGMPAAEIRFHYGSKGKPRLAAASALRFNLSHSEDVMLVATCHGQDIGVDVERILPLPELDQLAHHICHSRELTRLSLCEHDARRALFYRLWTCKEAWLKAQGLGLSESLRDVDMSLVPDSASTPDGPWIRGPSSAGSLLELVPKPGYVAAVAVMT